LHGDEQKKCVALV
jgi:hypothetical protein